MRNIPMEKLAKTYFDRVAATGAVMTSSRSSRASHQSSLQASMSRNVQESNNSSRWHGMNRLKWRNHFMHLPEEAAWAGELSRWGLPPGRWMIWTPVFWIGNSYQFPCQYNVCDKIKCDDDQIINDNSSSFIMFNDMTWRYFFAKMCQCNKNCSHLDKDTFSLNHSFTARGPHC